MDEAKAKAISANPSGHTHTECAQADRWIKDYALERFEEETKAIPQPLRDYIKPMVRLHYGTIETDQLLTALKCYPDWK